MAYGDMKAFGVISADLSFISRHILVAEMNVFFNDIYGFFLPVIFLRKTNNSCCNKKLFLRNIKTHIPEKDHSLSNLTQSIVI